MANFFSGPTVGFFLASNQIKLIYIVQLKVPSVRVVFTAL